MFTYQFWQWATERAVKTFAQSLLAIFSATGVGLLTVPWAASLLTAGMAAVLSVLTSMASAPVGEPNSPSLLPVDPRLHLRRPGRPSRRPSPPSQAVARLSSQGGHRGRTSRPESVFLRKRAGQQWADQVPRGLLHAATQVASSRRVSGEAGTTRRSTGRAGLMADGGLNDRRTAPLHTRSWEDAGHRSSRTPTRS